MKTFPKLLSVILSLTLAVGLMIPSAAAAGLSDISGNWAKSYIEEGVKAGYISGYSDGTFRPNNTVTRGAFCKIINQALGLTQMADISFSDVKSTDTFYSEIRKAVCAGYISGYTDGTFRASTTITRQQAAAMVSRLMPTPSPLKNLSTLKDASSVSSYAQEAVRALITTGYLTADSSGKFNPYGAMTRAQTCATISLLLKGETVVRSDVSFTTAGKTYSDNIYVGALSVSAGSVTFSNCKLLGSLTAISSTTLKLTDTDLVKLTVNAGAAGSTFTLSSGTCVSTAVMNGACTFAGTGTITSAVQNVSGVTYQTQPGSVTGSYSSTLMPASVTPASGSSGISVTPTISLQFSEALYNSAGGTLTAANIASSVLELRSGSASGTTVPFTASVSSDLKTISAVPAAALSGSVTYYVILLAGGLKSSSGAVNARQVFTFTTAAAASLTPSVIPANGAVNVSSSIQPTLTFSEDVYDGTLSTGLRSANYSLPEAIKLYRGSVSSDNQVSMNPTITGRVVTLAPGSALTAGSTYIIVLSSGYLKNASGITNTYQTYSFTVSASAAVTPTVSITGSTVVPAAGPITLQFSEGMYFSGSASNYIQLFTAAGTLVSSSVTFSSGASAATIYPSASLTSGAGYYVLVSSGIFYNASGAYCNGTILTFSPVSAAAATGSINNLTTTSVTQNSATIRFYATAAGGTAAITMTPNGGGSTITNTVAVAQGYNDCTLTGLTAGTSYFLNVTYNNSSYSGGIVTTTASSSLSSDASLASFAATNSRNISGNSVTLVKPATYFSSVTVNAVSGDTIAITAVPTSSTASCTLSLSSFQASGVTAQQISAVVKAADGTTQTYLITVNIAYV